MRLQLKKITILGIDIARINLLETLQITNSHINKKKQLIIFTANINHLVKTKKSREFRDIYQQADLVVADGVPLIWYSKIFGKPIPGRVNGTDLMEAILKLCNEKKLNIFFLGSTLKILIKLKQITNCSYPKLEIAGMYSPPHKNNFSEFDLEKINEKIKNKKIDFLLVALGPGKQEEWLIKNGRNKLNFNIGIAVGSSLDIVAGDKIKAPRFLKNIGLEWLWRFIQEPKRLGRRYISDFFWIFYYFFKHHLVLI